MYNVFENKKAYFALIFIFILIFSLIGCSKKENIADKNILTNTDNFITYLFENELEKAGELSLGIVKFNILSNKTELESSFNIKDLSSKLIFESEDLAMANSTVSYIDNINNEYDTVFYEIKLLKENDLWKVYHLNEVDPSFENESKKNKGADILAKKKELEEMFLGYTDKLSKGKYVESSKFLIGRAKKMHKKANPALSELNLVSKITDLETKIIYGEENNIIVKFNYNNDDRPISALVYFYLTEQGWRIYNVNQI